ncbi:hypothetical protein P4255_08485 [Bacillus wiedmannii]|uniref:hypothetical protein n=1 Tax=Bacillus wiedmannii TaxID=1890302 RepID=UPI002E202944|nr:hypothetical protein [Bacillus wiedmannii]
MVLMVLRACKEFLAQLVLLDPKGIREFKVPKVFRENRDRLALKEFKVPKVFRENRDRPAF